MAIAEILADTLKVLRDGSQPERPDAMGTGQLKSEDLQAILVDVEDQMAVLKGRSAREKASVLEMSKACKTLKEEYRSLSGDLEEYGLEMLEDDILDLQKEMEAEKSRVDQDRLDLSDLRIVRDKVSSALRALTDNMKIDPRVLAQGLSRIQETVAARSDGLKDVARVRSLSDHVGDVDAERRRKLREEMGRLSPTAPQQARKPTPEPTEPRRGQDAVPNP